MAQLRHLLAAPGVASAPPPPHATAAAGAAPLTMIQASSGSQIRMVPVAEVLYFEAADKYVRVLTAAREFLIRTPLKDLIAQLDPQHFWQVHRGTIVNVRQIVSAHHDLIGKVSLTLRDRPEKVTVSRSYAHLFRQM